MTLSNPEAALAAASPTDAPLVFYGLGSIGVGVVVAIFLHRVLAVRFFERIPTPYEIS